MEACLIESNHKYFDAIGFLRSRSVCATRAMHTRSWVVSIALRDVPFGPVNHADAVRDPFFEKSSHRSPKMRLRLVIVRKRKMR